MTTGSFGIGLDRWRGAVYIAIALIATAVVFFNRPVTVSAVIWTVILALIAVVIVELLQRPADEVAELELERAAADASAGVARPTPRFSTRCDAALGETEVLDGGETVDADGHPSTPHVLSG